MTDISIISGKWTYRSFRNSPERVDGDADKLLGLLFAEATIDLEVDEAGRLTGTIDWPGGGLNSSGRAQSAENTETVAFEIVGQGRPGTNTEGWRYDYDGHSAKLWTNGVDQVPALAGSLIRVNPHGGGGAGYVASFIAVRQPLKNRTAVGRRRRNALGTRGRKAPSGRTT